VRILGEVRDRYGFALAGYVVMPNHIHLLIREPPKGTLSTLLQVLKQRVSRQLRRKARKKVSPPATPPSISTRARFLTSILAATLLRLQRVESDQIRGETPIHAHESLEEKTSRTTQGLALEQFFLLLDSQGRIDPD
jgi:REP element-mobilizing transposase RayT